MGNFDTAETDTVMASIFKKKNDPVNDLEIQLKKLTPEQFKALINRVIE
jgi:hypothetical protein